LFKKGEVNKSKLHLYLLIRDIISRSKVYNKGQKPDPAQEQ